MRPTRGAAARARVAAAFAECSLSADTDVAVAMLRRERRCGDPELVRLLTRWVKAEQWADRAYCESLPSAEATAGASDRAWDAVRRYVEGERC